MAFGSAKRVSAVFLIYPTIRNISEYAQVVDKASCSHVNSGQYVKNLVISPLRLDDPDTVDVHDNVQTYKREQYSSTFTHNQIDCAIWRYKAAYAKYIQEKEDLDQPGHVERFLIQTLKGFHQLEGIRISVGNPYIGAKEIYDSFGGLTRDNREFEFTCKHLFSIFSGILDAAKCNIKSFCIDIAGWDVGASSRLRKYSSFPKQDWWTIEPKSLSHLFDNRPAWAGSLRRFGLTVCEGRDVVEVGL